MLAGKRILIVEDEPIIAMAIDILLTDLGAEIVGPVASVADARAALSMQAVDAAILDINLSAERSDEVADDLRRSGTPFIFATGYGDGERSARNGETVIEKPYRAEIVTDALAAAMSRANSISGAGDLNG